MVDHSEQIGETGVIKRGNLFIGLPQVWDHNSAAAGHMSGANAVKAVLKDVTVGGASPSRFAAVRKVSGSGLPLDTSSFATTASKNEPIPLCWRLALT